jgi:hypothetical protein
VNDITDAGLDYSLWMAPEMTQRQAKLTSALIMKALPPSDLFTSLRDFYPLHLSFKSTESSLPLQLRHSRAYRLPDPAFQVYVLTRVGFVAHPNRTHCFLCSHPADHTLAHDLCCTASSRRSNLASRRHTNIQETFKSCVKPLRPRVTLDAMQPRYQDYYALRVGQQPTKIVKADVLVTLASDTDPIDTTFSVDFTVAGLNRALLDSNITASLAENAEKRKWDELRSVYVVETPTDHHFVPFAMEITGKFGPSALAFLKRLVPTRHERPIVLLEQHPERRVDDIHVSHIWAIKAALVSSMWSSNSAIFSQYMDTLKARKAYPPVGTVIPNDVVFRFREPYHRLQPA